MKSGSLSKQIAVAAVCVILGFGITVQLVSVKKTQATSSTALSRVQDLQNELSREKTKNEELYTQLLQMKNDLDGYKEAAEESGSVSQVLNEQLSRAEFLAGLTNVSGPGVVVTLNDAKVDTSQMGGANPENFLLHDEDIRTVINELLASGAEAVSLNGERIVSTSSIRCTGPTVIVNNSRHSTPFVIKAIGDPKTLEAGLMIKDGVVDNLRRWQIIVDIQTSDKIEIEAYKGVSTPKYAKDAGKGDGE